MLSRTPHDQEGTALPKKWVDETCSLFESTFKGKYLPSENRFYVFGQTFSSEIFIAISFVGHDIEKSVPVTYCSSCEIKTDQNYSKIPEHMIDSAGIFFESYFNDSNWNEYCSNWTEFNYRGVKIHYKVTRENIELTLKANELLKG